MRWSKGSEREVISNITADTHMQTFTCAHAKWIKGIVYSNSIWVKY